VIPKKTDPSWVNIFFLGPTTRPVKILNRTDRTRALNKGSDSSERLDDQDLIERRYI